MTELDLIERIILLENRVSELESQFVFPVITIAICIVSIVVNLFFTFFFPFIVNKHD